MRKYARVWIEKYPSIARMNEAMTGPRRMGSESSVEGYIVGVSHFVKYLGFSEPEIALQKMLSEEINATAKADEFIDFSLKKYAHKTVRFLLSGVKKWLELNGVKVDWGKIEMPTSTEGQETDRAPSKEEIKLLLNHAKSARDRAAILVLASSGLRIGTFVTLKIGDADLTTYPDVGMLKVEKRRGRKFTSKRKGAGGRFFFTFITPEAKKALQEYIEERKRTGEKLDAESPLIGDAWNHGTFPEVQDLQRSWYRLLERSGLAQRGKKWHTFHLHTLRKYFRSNCVGVDPSYREFWMGHKGGYLDESYFRAEEHLHVAEYRKAIPHLTVQATATDEKSLRKKMLLDFARIQGAPEEELRKLDEILARAKTIDEGIGEFRKLKDETEKNTTPEKTTTTHDRNNKYRIVRGEDKLIEALHHGFKLVQPLTDEKYLLEITSSYVETADYHNIE